MRVDAAELEIFKNLFHSVAEEMGAALRRSAFSPNIKERRDYSCAVFDGLGRVVAMGDHMPVHLGSMPMSVAAAIDAIELGPGDIAMLNDPYAGGTHLPDITLVMPVPNPERRTLIPVFYVANRAHHSDVGGAQPASMGLSEDIYQEGLRIPPVALARGGRIQRDVLALLVSNVRTPREREGDLTAQLAACRLGERRLRELLEKYGARKTVLYLEALERYSARLMREALRRIPDGDYAAEDFLDDDGFSARPVRLRVTVRIRGERATVDFTGTSPACRGSVNNLSFGGAGPRSGEAFAYYETIAGGMGARPTADGLSGVHTHMTNSLNTPIEAFESAYPVRVRRYSLRRGSGGAGKFRGGDGIVREIEFLADVRGSIISDRRCFKPWGLAGGKPGRPGRNQLLLPAATRRPKRVLTLPSKAMFNAPRGSILRIETPGGGGWGKPNQKSETLPCQLLSLYQTSFIED